MQCTEVEEEVEVVELAAFKGNNDEGGGVERGDADLSDRREWMSCFQARSSDVSLDNNKQQTAVSEPTLVCKITLLPPTPSPTGPPFKESTKIIMRFLSYL